jgi:inhibitor of cysteine peptidase
MENRNSTDATATITERDAGRDIGLRAGETLRLRLAANRTTGYRWHASGAEDGCLSVPQSPEYIPDQASPRVAGAGGIEVWQLRAQRPGTVVLRFDYRRPYETQKPPAKTLSFTIRIR